LYICCLLFLYLKQSKNVNKIKKNHAVDSGSESDSSLATGATTGATVLPVIVAGAAAVDGEFVAGAAAVDDGEFVAGAAAVDDGEFVAGAAISTPAFGAISVISMGFCTILDISMSPSGGCGVLAGGAGGGGAGGGGAGGFKAGIISPLSESNAAFTLSAKLVASKAVDMVVFCASTTCFKLGILSYNALPILPTTFNWSNFFRMYIRMLSAAL